ncbi:unnamed protein product [Lasius platythorax]|uniref:Reverse transcriptase domain-containing protein n=1 Tax=Lasius platythorax TaxID=488582 RepID=A0AAV2MXN9_9HYME
MKLVVKAAGEKICEVLNKSLEEGMFPTGWKEAIVVPIPKVRGTIKVEEFRPINKLPVYEKVLEIVVYKQLIEYLEKNNLLKECQSGFRARHSCETVLQCIISEWKREIAEGKMIGVVFLDLRRAFEVVNRKILISKLEGYGLKESVLNWFKSYLDNRTQRVKFNGILSPPVNVDVGVPQGSVLGPLLFLLYINDITEVIKDTCEIKLFADDAIIYTAGYSSKEISDKLNEKMKKIEKWLKINRLKLNIDKTKVMLLRGVRKKVMEENFRVIMQNKMLEVVSEIKYLGVIIDKNLNFSAHVDYISKKVGAKLGIMRRTGASMSSYMKCTVYKAVVAPILEYCASVLIGISKTNVNNLQKLQNQGMRIILKCNKKTRIRDMLEALHFTSIDERIEYNVCLLVYKMINGMCPSYLYNKSELVKHRSAINTRQKENVYIERCRSREEQKMLLHDGFKMYNKLPNDIKKEQRLQNYRRMLAQHIIRKRECGVGCM